MCQSSDTQGRERFCAGASSEYCEILWDHQLYDIWGSYKYIFDVCFFFSTHVRGWKRSMTSVQKQTRAATWTVVFHKPFLYLSLETLYQVNKNRHQFQNFDQFIDHFFLWAGSQLIDTNCFCLNIDYYCMWKTEVIRIVWYVFLLLKFLSTTCKK
jgi:hypothetical protein